MPLCVAELAHTAIPTVSCDAQTVRYPAVLTLAVRMSSARRQYASCNHPGRQRALSDTMRLQLNDRVREAAAAGATINTASQLYIVQNMSKYSVLSFTPSCYSSFCSPPFVRGEGELLVYVDRLCMVLRLI